MATPLAGLLVGIAGRCWRSERATADGPATSIEADRRIADLPSEGTRRAGTHHDNRQAGDRQPAQRGQFSCR